MTTFHVFQNGESVATAGKRSMAIQMAGSAAMSTDQAVSVKRKDIGNGKWITEAVLQESAP